MYRNLKAEMCRQGITPTKIANILGIMPRTARLKINGKVPFRMDECRQIAALFQSNNDLDYLFKD
jgi:hypothetical protein